MASEGAGCDRVHSIFCKIWFCVAVPPVFQKFCQFHRFLAVGVWQKTVESNRALVDLANPFLLPNIFMQCEAHSFYSNTADAKHEDVRPVVEVTFFQRSETK